MPATDTTARLVIDSGGTTSPASSPLLTTAPPDRHRDMTAAMTTETGPGNLRGDAVRLSTAVQLVLEDLREQEPHRYDHLGAVEVYREWLHDMTTVVEIDEAERGRQLTAELAGAFRLVLTAGYGQVMTVLLDLEPLDGATGVRLVVAS